jgi:predicted metal-binding protein
MSSSSRSSTSSSDMWRGRHSNSWLFNDFSVTEHAKDLLHMGRKS